MCVCMYVYVCICIWICKCKCILLQRWKGDKTKILLHQPKDDIGSRFDPPMHRVINMDKCAGWQVHHWNLTLNWGLKRGSPPRLIWVTSSVLDLGLWMMEDMRKYADIWPFGVWFIHQLGNLSIIQGAGRSRGRSLHLVVKRSSNDNPFQHNWPMTNHRHDWKNKIVLLHTSSMFFLCLLVILLLRKVVI